MKTFLYIKQQLTQCQWSILLFGFLLVGCEDFLEPETPLNQIEQQNVFNTEAKATAAVTTMYGNLRDQGFLSGGLSGNGFVFGLYADELDYHYYPGFAIESFYLHQVLPTNTALTEIWNPAYKVIYSANAVLNGLENAPALSSEIKRQLKGEALFVGAFCHFHLVNSFGAIPYIKTTDYPTNTSVSRMPIQEVYENIIADLLEASTLLGAEYVGSERVRPNNFVVSALLARVYLYQGDWNSAERESSRLISSTALFSLDSDINNVFLKDSPATIWQFKPKYEGDNTVEGSIYIITDGPPENAALNPAMLDAMEAGDLRRENWIGEVSDGSQTWYFPNKYKEKTNTGTSLEYSKIFRLAEQYLIRSEARLMLGDINGAQEDLNKVRTRAGLGNTSASTIAEMQDAILAERRFELFTEFGHRWFDLKRTNMAPEILSSIKPGWRNTDILLPIPDSELVANPKLNPQNPGY